MQDPLEPMESRDRGHEDRDWMVGIAQLLDQWGSVMTYKPRSNCKSKCKYPNVIGRHVKINCTASHPACRDRTTGPRTDRKASRMPFGPFNLLRANRSQKYPKKASGTPSNGQSNSSARFRSRPTPIRAPNRRLRGAPPKVYTPPRRCA